MSDDLNKDEIDFIIKSLSIIEGFTLNGATWMGKDKIETCRNVNEIKTKLYRMRDGIEIKQELKKLENEE